mgnify:CR=1 FL=1
MNLLQKLESGERLSKQEAFSLYELDLFTLAKFADKKRRKLHGNKVFFNVNRHINPTNLCADTCLFCAFSAHRKNDGAYKKKENCLLDVILLRKDIAS